VNEEAVDLGSLWVFGCEVVGVRFGKAELGVSG
jgi:hypothetical protein